MNVPQKIIMNIVHITAVYNITMKVQL